MKFIAPSKLDTPAKCKLKIAKSTLPPEWLCTPANGGYTVHPVPAPFSTKALNNNKISEGGNNQNDILFKRGNQFIWVISYSFGLCLHPICIYLII